MASPLLASVAEDLAIGAGAAGWLVTAFAVGYIVGGPILGALADRHGPRRVLLGALFLFAIANLATGLASSLFPLFLSRVAAGLAASGVTPCVYALVSASAPDGRRARWLAVTTAGMLSALAAGAPAGALLEPTIGWRGVFVGVGLLAAAVLVLCRSERGGTRPVPATARPPIPVPLGHRVRAVGTTTLWAAALYGLYTYLGVGLAHSAGLAPGAVAVALAGYGVAAVAGNLSAGALADRYEPSRVAVASLAALAALAVALGFAIQGDLVWVVLVLGLLAGSAYPYFTAHQLRLLATYPDASATLLAWNNAALYVGILAGSALGAQILTVTGFSELAWLLSAVAAAGALASARPLPPVRRPVNAREGS
ncbi:MAG: MFS transporter [Micromonosporaceae bacterium]|nr:MFS transporter [Micromonosporaceae bacterium]